MSLKGKNLTEKIQMRAPVGLNLFFHVSLDITTLWTFYSDESVNYHQIQEITNSHSLGNLRAHMGILWSDLHTEFWANLNHVHRI